MELEVDQEPLHDVEKFGTSYQQESLNMNNGYSETQIVRKSGKVCQTPRNMDF